MKETIKVNLGGRLFNLDNDAYERLRKYLDSLKRKFSASPKEAEEIVEDIEARIAELFETKIAEKKQVITLADVEEVISQLGTAEEMDSPEDEEEASETHTSRTKSQTRTKKRFYRETDNSVIGGVCSGLAAYFDIDPIWIRLLFVVLFFANLAGFLIYVILWIVIPPARTTAQKLEMRGKPVNISNIEESVKEEIDKVKTSIKNISSSKGYQNIESGLAEFFRILGNILLVFVKVIGIIVGVSLLVALIVTLLGLIAGSFVFFPGEWFHGWNWPHVISWPHFTLAGICLFLVITIPIIAILTKIAKWVFGIKTRNNFAAGIGATVWVLALITFIVLLVVDIDRGTFRKTEHTEYILEYNVGVPLTIDVDIHENPDHQLEYYQFFDFEFVRDEWNDDYLGNPIVTLKRSNEDHIKIDVYKSYFHFYVGKNPYRSRNLADFEWDFEDSRLSMDEYYTVDEDYVWRLPKVKVIITVPENLEINCDKDAAEIFKINCSRLNELPVPKKEKRKDDKIEILEELEESLE